MKSLEDANEVLELTRKLIDCPDCDGLMEEATQLQCGHVVCTECAKEIHNCSKCGEKSGKKHEAREDMKELCDILKQLHTTFKTEFASIAAAEPKSKSVENTNRFLNCYTKPSSPAPASASSDKPELPEYNAFDQLLETLPEPSDPYNFIPSQSTYPAKRAKKARKTYGRKPLNTKTFDYKTILQNRQLQPRQAVDAVAEVVVNERPKSGTLFDPVALTISSPKGKTKTQPLQNEIQPTVEKETNTNPLVKPVNLSIPLEPSERNYLPGKSGIEFVELDFVLDLTLKVAVPRSWSQSEDKNSKRPAAGTHDLQSKPKVAKMKKINEEIQSQDIFMSSENENEEPEDDYSFSPHMNKEEARNKFNIPLKHFKLVVGLGAMEEEEDVNEKSFTMETVKLNSARLKRAVNVYPTEETPPKKKVRREREDSSNHSHSDSDGSSSDSDDGFFGKFLSPVCTDDDAPDDDPFFEIIDSSHPLRQFGLQNNTADEEEF